MSGGLTMTEDRPIPRRIAGIAAALESLSPVRVTRDQLSELLNERSRRAVTKDELNQTIAALRDNGWLLSTRTRGVWEYAPAARAGAYRSGDPFDELRSALLAGRISQDEVAITMESAAFRHGLALHPPAREAIAVPAESEAKGAYGAYRLVRLQLPPIAHADFEGLRVHTVAGLLAAMAIKPNAYRDWPNVGRWLPRAIDSLAGAGFQDLAEILRLRPKAAWARAAYLLGTHDLGARNALLHDAPELGAGPYYLGPRGRQGTSIDSPTRVIDSLLRR